MLSNRVLIERLEDRRLCFASIPTGDAPLETVQIRPTAGTYASALTLTKGVTYFLRATGYTRTGANVYHGDAAFIASSSTATTTGASWGISTTVGTTTTATTGWGAIQSDHVYGQRITPTATGALSFTFANDALDRVSTLAVTIYAPVPGIRVATINNNQSTGLRLVKSLAAKEVLLPLNSADWDQNGIADDKQSGAVAGDKFLLPLTLPEIPGVSTKAHISIQSPRGVRVWLNSDRTGSTVNLGLRATKPHVVYVEGTAEQTKQAAVDLKVFLPIAGISVEQDVPIAVFALRGATTATGGSKQTYSADLRTGAWSSAVGGTLDAANIRILNHVAFADVVWNKTTQIGFAEFEADADFIWGWPVAVTA